MGVCLKQVKIKMILCGVQLKLSLQCCLKAALFITTATVLGHAWIALKIPCLKNDSCPPAENMLLIFM